jgi:hypothetical protein
MTESGNDDGEFGPTRIEILEDKAKEAKSKEDFLEILRGISEICLTDNESWERRMVHFVDVVEDFIKCDMIDMPPDQDLRWVSKLFLIGAFEN